jgi:mRNA interferase RelE/StbE
VKVEFRKSFARDLRVIRSDRLREKVREVIQFIEEVGSAGDIPNLMRLREAGGYYRIRIGSYRVGLIIKGQEVTFVRCLHRREIYRYFP